jgi:hypothetical protein
MAGLAVNPQDRPARRFDEPPAYEDLELRPEEWRHVRVSDELFRQLGASGVDWGQPDKDGFYTPTVYRNYDPDITARSHLGAIVIVVAILVLVVIAAALFLRGAS